MDRGRRPEHRPVGHCLVADIDAASDVVGFTIAEFFPRQVTRLQQILDGFPLVSGTPATR
jgi:hypothetical protein